MNLSWWANKIKWSITKLYDWASQQYDRAIGNDFVSGIRNNIVSVSTVSVSYSHFERTCRESAAKDIPLKLKNETFTL